MQSFIFFIVFAFIRDRDYTVQWRRFLNIYNPDNV